MDVPRQLKKAGNNIRLLNGEIKIIVEREGGERASTKMMKTYLKAR